MTEQMTVDTDRGSIGWSFDIPSGFNAMHRPVPTLVYPWELLGAGDWKFPASVPATTEEEQRFGDHPRVDLMPPTGAFVWLLMRDLRYDLEIEPGPVDQFTASPALAPTGTPSGAKDGATTTTVAPLTDADSAVGDIFAGVSYWAREIPLTTPDAQAEGQPLYLAVSAYAAPDRANIDDVNSLISSLAYRYL